MATNCPNCGAPITGPVCEYCGTRHYSQEILTARFYAENELVYAQTQLSQAAQTQYLLSTMQKWTAWAPN